MPDFDAKKACHTYRSQDDFGGCPGVAVCRMYFVARFDHRFFTPYLK